MHKITVSSVSWISSRKTDVNDADSTSLIYQRDHAVVCKTLKASDTLELQPTIVLPRAFIPYGQRKKQRPQ